MDFEELLEKKKKALVSLFLWLLSLQQQHNYAVTFVRKVN